MSTTVASILLGLKYKEDSRRDAEELLEQKSYGELEEVRDEALELVSDYNSNLERIDTYLDEPYQVSFAVTAVSNPKNFWKRLGYCEALSGESYSD